MTIELMHYQFPLVASRLAAALQHPDNVPTAPTGYEIDLDAVFAVLSQLGENPPSAAWDRAILETFHQAFRSVPRRVLADMRVWHWVTTVPLSRFVWYRWNGELPAGDPSDALGDGMVERFLGSASLRGISRNALARIYWCGETLFSETDGYAYAHKALSNQDFFQAIFERLLGLYPPAARSCIRVLEGVSEAGRRAAVRKLNHYLTTIAVETLSETDIDELLLS